MEAFKAIIFLFKEILKPAGLDTQMTRGEGHLGCGLGSGRMVAPFNGTVTMEKKSVWGED